VNKTFYTTLNEVWLASIPLIIGGSIVTLMAFLDALFIWIFSVKGFNALVLAIPIISFVNAFASGIAASGGDALAKSESMDVSHLNIYVSFLLALLVGISLTLLSYLLLPDICGYYKLDEENLKEENVFFISYFLWVLPSFLFQTISALFIQLLVVRKKIRRANFILLWIVIINIALNPILIFVCHLGVKGAAIATDIAFIFGFICCTRELLKEFPQILERKNASFLTFMELKIFLKKCLSQFINAFTFFFAIAIFAIYGILFTKLASKFGTIQLTIFGITEQIKGIFTLPTRGVCGAYISIFGISLAKKEHQRYFDIYWSATLIVGVINLLGIILLLIFPDFLIGLFGKFDSHFVLDGVFFLTMGGISLMVSIFPRNAHVGFLSLGHSYGVLLQSILIVVTSYFFSLLFMNRYGFRGIALGQLIGGFLSTVPMLMYYFFLLKRRIATDSKILNSA
jgi:Na+-driven multidrug efflux pump